MKSSKAIIREDIISGVYRCVRDGIDTDFRYVFREKNKITFLKGDKKVSITFRIKIEEDTTPSWSEIMP